MSNIPERDLVDKALASAREKLTVMQGHERCSTQACALAGVAIDCTEAIVRQLRDHDDTQFAASEKLTADLADLAIVIGGNRG